MGEILLPLAVLATLVTVLVGLWAVILARRLLLARGVGTFDCSLRRTNRRGGGTWMLGVARYEANRLDWFRVLTLSPRPTRSLARERLVILDRRQADEVHSYAILPGWVIVSCAYGTSMLELAMSEAAYNGLATWLESAPPGRTAQIA
ncbi:MAG TPA: DUF2550 domain-containing protein [Kineosporiaceae bacterium]|nr:DUF2550 domain-containing protein [Kineosporiaceae bacterium]